VRLVLASGSPRRAELLKAAGFSFEILRVDVDERPLMNEAASHYVLRLARDKSARAIELLTDADTGHRGTSIDDCVVVGADTAVVIDGFILGKPRADGEAYAMLERLSGRAHQVMTGVSVRSAGQETSRVETSTVWFAPLTPEEMRWYVASGEGRDKAGAYAIQGLASRFIPRIDGSYSNVVGLPIALVSEMLAGVDGSTVGRGPRC
jgi:septum formation protein